MSQVRPPSASFSPTRFLILPLELCVFFHSASACICQPSISGVSPSLSPFARERKCCLCSVCVIGTTLLPDDPVVTEACLGVTAALTINVDNVNTPWNCVDFIICRTLYIIIVPVLALPYLFFVWLILSSSILPVLVQVENLHNLAVDTHQDRVNSTSAEADLAGKQRSPSAVADLEGQQWSPSVKTDLAEKLKTTQDFPTTEKRGIGQAGESEFKDA